MQLVESEDPDWIVGSPPCTSFSLLNRGLNYPKMDALVVEEKIREGLLHLRFVCALYKRQVRCGKWFLHEHPKDAASWRCPYIERLLRMPKVETSVCHQCMYGLVTPNNDGVPTPAKKPTKWMSNSSDMLSVLSRKCDKSHAHQHLLGGRAAAAAFYPPPLLRAILKGMALTRDNALGVKMIMNHQRELAENHRLHSCAVVDAKSVDEPTGDATNSAGTTTAATAIPLTGGGEIPISYEAHNFKSTYQDEYTGEVLPTHLVRAAMEEELGYFNAHVWDAVEKKKAEHLDGFKLVRMRWVICNKGDEKEYDVRARLVACEVNTYKSDDYFASTPPLEAKRLLFSEYAHKARHQDYKHRDIRLSFVDVKKAYFNGVPRRNVHLVFPKELGMPTHLIAHLKRCVYGTRDAGAIWEDCYADALVGLGFARGEANPCCFYHHERDIMVVVHGDDFTALGSCEDIAWYEDGLAAKFEIKRRGHIGEGPGCVTEMRILNRIVRLTDHGLRYEADPRHAEMLVKALDLTDSKSVLTPGVKSSSDQTNFDAQLNHEDDKFALINDDKDDSDMVAPVLDISGGRKSVVHFSVDPPDVCEITPYAEIYGNHPRRILATRDGWVNVSDRADPFTGKTDRVMTKRRDDVRDSDRMKEVDDERRNAINALYWFGSPWEIENLGEACGGRWSDRAGDEPNSVRTDDPKAGPALETHVVPKVEENGGQSINVVRTPGSKSKFQKRQGAKAVKKVEIEGNLHDLLTPEDATTFRGLSARGNYLAQDRVDISFATKELCREFAAPAHSSFQNLKRLVRFLAGTPRLVYRYDWAHDEPRDLLTAMVDTDFAGCRVSRRSTSGGVLMRGSHCLRHWSSTQTTIALSSGEAELGGLCKGAANAIGMRSVARDLGIKFKLNLASDATAALGMSRRLGVGKVRHLDTSLLWIQHKIREGELTVSKIAGVGNPADVLTKHVDHALMKKHLATMGLEYEGGRAALAPELSSH